jgi:ribonuclease Z
MKITFLGTGAGNFRGSRRIPVSAYVEGLLLDCGAGATGRLHDIQVFDHVDAVLISHLHSDHIAGLFDFLLHTLITKRQRPLTLLSPPGLSSILASVYAAKGTVVDPSTRYELRLIESERPEATVGRWRIRGVPLSHTILDLGFHLHSDGVSIFYTGDTREPSATLDTPADYLIHEATYSDRHRSIAREYGHSTALQAADAARTTGARRLFLTHVGDLPDVESEVSEEVHRRFPDSVVAEDRSSYDL